MWTDEQFEQLEKEEREIIDEYIAIMILILAHTKDNFEKELRAFYQKYGKDGVITYNEARKWVSNKNHQRRITVLTAFFITEFSRLKTELTVEFAQMLKSVSKKESDFFNENIDDILEDILDKKWGYDESTWLERLSNDVDMWQAYITSDCKRAMMRQDSIDDVIQQMNKRFKSIDSVIHTLGITESTAIGSLIRKEIFKELGITKYQHYEIMDERTCEICKPMYGLIFPISAYEVGVTASPLHPRCRGWEIPIIE